MSKFGFTAEYLASLPARQNPPVSFTFRPLDYVWVNAFGLRYRGRVQYAEWRQNDVQRYWVEYVNDRSEIQSGFFHHDELALARREEFEP